MSKGTVIEPFGGGGCAFSPNDTRDADDEMRDFEEHVEEAMQSWRSDFEARNGRAPTGDEENEHYRSLRDAPPRQEGEAVTFDGDCPF